MTTEAESRVCRRIRQAAQRQTLSHALILSGEGDRVHAARFAAAAMECEAPTGKPCLSCNACRKVLRDIHPDVIFVRDPEHQTLSVDIVRAARQDAYIRPNEGARKIYIFEDCTRLTPVDQNALLKIVEEGPSYVAFIFCVENAASLLATTRSRCVELRLEERGEPAASPEADALCAALAERNFHQVLTRLVGMEKLSRDAACDVLTACRETLGAWLIARYKTPEGAPAKKLTAPQLSALADAAEHYAKEFEYNAGVGHVLAALAAEWEEIL